MRDGGVELRLRLSSLAEVQRWILGWGGSATVLRPAALRKAVAAAGARIAQRHA
jgi:predicted DNA-binding transcriptional regulator YafY